MAWFSNTGKSGSKHRDDLWVQCRHCHAHVFHTAWANNIKVCPKCNYHGKLSARERIDIILDAGSFIETNAGIAPADPLEFIDSKGSYADQAAVAKAKTKLNESIVTGTGAIDSLPVVIGVMDFRFLGGSLGSGTGEKILLAANHAYQHRIPLIICAASGGARMQEGILSLMQMAKTCVGISRLHERNVPYISIMTDPTTGGVSASFAMVGDINISEPGALIGFAGRRVIEQTIRQKLPADFQTAEFVQQHGFMDLIVDRKDLRNTLANILLYTAGRRS